MNSKHNYFSSIATWYKPFKIAIANINGMSRKPQ